MSAAALDYSKKRIDKCGKLVRRATAILRDGDQEAWGSEGLDPADVIDAMEVIDGFRAHHARPLAKVNANLRHYVRKAGVEEPEVTQRLKRFSTIVDKLEREPTMALSKMEDIAGVRAVLENQEQADKVCELLVKARKWRIRRIRNYAETSKDDGYRAIHIIVEKDECYVEIQLRTPWQDTWAQSVEQDTRRLRAGLKFGSGPDDLREYYRMVSEYFTMREAHLEVDEEFMEELAKLYAATRSYFPEPNGESGEK